MRAKEPLPIRFVRLARAGDPTRPPATGPRPARPSSAWMTWARHLRDEALIGHIGRMQGVVYVAHAGVTPEELPEEPSPPLPLAAAAACAIEACEVLAGLHAGGFASAQGDPISFSSLHLQAVAHGPAWHIAWRIPARTPTPASLPQITDADLAELLGDASDINPVARDLQDLLRWFTALCGDALADRSAPPDERAAIDALRRFAGNDPDTSMYACAAFLARLFVPLVSAPDSWAARVAAIPVVHTLPPVSLDWDAVIAEGEAILADPSRPDHLLWRGRDVPVAGWIELPLASAYHQRAARAFAQGELAAALRDSERAAALDDYFAYHTTRAIVLDALGQTAESRAVMAAAWPPPGRYYEGQDVIGGERARTRATLGLFALHDGTGDHGVAHLRRACELRPIAPYFHGLAAALAAAGHPEGALAAERLAVEKGPYETRHRWALVARLHALGRVAEARAHAETAVREWPRDHERFLRYFGEPPASCEEDDFPFTP